MEVAASSSSTPSSSNSPSNWEHDVFLSFRGEDTRHGFTDHLYFALNQRGIDTFRDTDKLPRGTSISLELVEAIQESRFAVILFSINYATSSWCLDELAYILECKKLRRLEVLPVFYHVEPSEVRKQARELGMEIAKHETDFEEKKRKVNKWKEALKEISGLSGWHVTKDRGESEIIQEIVKRISDILNNMLCNPDRDLIGMDARMEKMKCYLDLRSNDVFAAGIWGMGGIGKTALAKEVFKNIRNQFDVSGFVSDVRLYSEKKALVELQKLLCGSFFGDSNINIDTVERGIRLLKKVLCKKKVLIVLDDVEELKQLKDLAPGIHNEEYFWAPGSRLIITTRDRRTLTECGVLEYRIYEVEKLSDIEACQLICQQAFKKNYPPAEFVELSNSFVKYASGLPLALKVLGSHLSGREIDEWLEVLYRLDEDLDKDIFSVLQISFDGLHETDKKIFLDIACFFNGEDHVRVKRILKSCGFSSGIGITNLINKSLIKIERKKLWMHDLLRRLGWHIVRRESVVPGKRSRLWLDDNSYNHKRRRLWHMEDARNVITENTGTTAVEVLFLSLPEKEEICLNEDPFLTMHNLRLLKICNVKFTNVQLTYLSKKLRYLEWHECPLESLSSWFTPDLLVSLVELKMPNSRIERLWNGRISLEMLILMDLSNCQYLTMTPNFSTIPNLERLILEGCKYITEVHHTIGDLQHLFFLNLKGCTSLESLPQSISLRSLRTFILSGCSKLIQFSESVENMDALAELYLDGTAIWELPASIQHLKGLILLNLSGCRNLLTVPSILCSSLTSLKFLYLSLCSSMDNLPDNIGCLEHLEELDACCTAIRKVPESTSRLKNLKLLCFHGCSGSTGLELPDKFSGLRSLTTLNLGACNLAEDAIPEDIGDLFSLQSLDLSENNLIFTIPESISKLPELREISLFKCSKLQSLPKDLPSSLKNVNIRGCPMLTNSSSSWKRYPPQKGLSIINCRKPEVEDDEIFPELHKFCLGNLKELDLSHCQHLKKIPDLNGVPNLKKLNLEGCVKLFEVHPTIGRLQHLIFLNLEGCVDLVSLPRSISLKSLKIFVLSGCSKLKEFPDIIGDMDHLSELHLDGTALKYLAVWKNQLKCPISINLSGCRNLLTVPVLLSLKSLNLSGCKRISRLPSDPECMVHLEELDASETSIKQVHQSYLFLQNVQVLSFCGCKGLQLPKWLSGLTNLTSLNLRRCGLAEDVLDILYGLSSLKILDLGENSFLTIPNDIGRLSSLHRLDLSGNHIASIPHEIGYLFSLQLLDLSENNFVTIPNSISRLSELTVLLLVRCSKLQSLPNNLPFNLKHVYAQECPMLKYNADTLTIRASGKGFCFMHCGKSEQDDDQPAVPIPEDRIELVLPSFIADRVYGKKPLEIRFPHSARIPNFWSHWRSGSSVTFPLSDCNTACMGLALFVAFEILDLEEGKFNKIWELEETICEFFTDDGCKHSVVFQHFIDFKVGSYALCYYEPRGGQFGGMIDKPSSGLRASVSTQRWNLKVRGCGIRLISEEDAAEFVTSLANLTATQHLDSNFDHHCKYILDEETTTGYLMEQGSTSTSIEDSSSRHNLNIQPSNELFILYEGRNGREKSFYLGFPAPVISFPPWFFIHHAGDVTLCQLTENLLDDQTWVGLELYGVFTRRASASSNGDKSFSFHVDFGAHYDGNIVSNGSLELHSFLGTSDQLVVLHLPRVCFPQRLNRCQGINALFRSVDIEMEVQVCGSRLLFERDLQDLIHSLAAASASTLGEHVLPQPGSQAYICMVEDPISEAQAVDVHRSNRRKTKKTKKKNAGTVDQGNKVEGEMPVFSSCWFKRRTVQVLTEQAPTSSIMRLQNYRCHLQQNQGSVDFNILLHSRGCLMDNNPECVVVEDTALLLSKFHHLCIMAETLIYGRYSSQQWKRYLKLLLQYSRATTISFNGQPVSALEHFNPSSPYNICLSTRGIPLWLRGHMSYRSRVGMKLPPKLCDDNNWRGLVICAAFKVHDQHPLPSVVKLLSHLRSEDYCLNHIPMCSITIEKLLEPFYLGGFIWVTYLPRVLLSEFRVVSDIEARIYINWPGFTVEECGIRLLYRQEEEEFRKVITGCWTSFFDNLSLIRQLVQADESVSVGERKWKGDEFPMPKGLTKKFDRDSIYNAFPPCTNIPRWFGYYPETWPSDLRLQLPAPDKSWVGLALCATYCDPESEYHIKELYDSYYFSCRLDTIANNLSSLHEYQMSYEESKRLKDRHPRGKFIWLSYMPRSWFMHQLNGVSFLFATFDEKGWTSRRGAHRFVYEDDVEEFKQLCIDLHR